jgi:hypothetical protein
MGGGGLGGGMGGGGGGVVTCLNYFQDPGAAGRQAGSGLKMGS